MKDYKLIDIKLEIFIEEGIIVEIIDFKLDKLLKGKFRIIFVLEFILDEV